MNAEPTPTPGVGNKLLRRNTIMAKVKKLTKAFEGDVLNITEGTTGEVLSFDINDLSDDMIFLLAKHGLSQKIGDACAAKDVVGELAIEAMTKVWNGLVAGNFTVRQPAAPKGRKALEQKLAAIPEGVDKEEAVALLRKLGLL